MKTTRLCTGTAASLLLHCVPAPLIISLPHSHQIRGIFSDWTELITRRAKAALWHAVRDIVLYACNPADMEPCWHWPVTWEEQWGPSAGFFFKSVGSFIWITSGLNAHMSLYGSNIQSVYLINLLCPRSLSLLCCALTQSQKINTAWI